MADSPAKPNSAILHLLKSGEFTDALQKSGGDLASFAAAIGVPLTAEAQIASAAQQTTGGIRSDLEKRLSQAATAEDEIAVRQLELEQEQTLRPARQALADAELRNEIANTPAAQGVPDIEIERKLTELRDLQSRSANTALSPSQRARADILVQELGGHPKAVEIVNSIETNVDALTKTKVEKVVAKAAKELNIPRDAVPPTLVANLQSGVKNKTYKLNVSDVKKRIEIIGAQADDVQPSGAFARVSDTLKNITGHADATNAQAAAESLKPIGEAAEAAASAAAKRARFVKGARVGGVAGGALLTLAVLANMFKSDTAKGGEELTPQQLFLLQQQQKTAQEQALADALIASRQASAQLKSAQAAQLQGSQQTQGLDAILKMLQIQQLQGRLQGGGGI